MKRLLTNKQFWIGVGVGYIVVPMVAGKVTGAVKRPVAAQPHAA